MMDDAEIDLDYVQPPLDRYAVKQILEHLGQSTITFEQE